MLWADERQIPVGFPIASSEDVLGKVSSLHLSWQFVKFTHFLAMLPLHPNLVFRIQRVCAIPSNRNRII